MIGLCILSMLFSLCPLAFGRYPTMRRIRKVYGEEEFCVILDAEGIEQKTAATSPVIKWAHFSKFVEIKNHFAFYKNNTVIFLIPKRAFADESELEQFRAWVSGIGQKETPLVVPILEP